MEVKHENSPRGKFATIIVSILSLVLLGIVGTYFSYDKDGSDSNISASASNGFSLSLGKEKVEVQAEMEQELAESPIVERSEIQRNQTELAIESVTAESAKSQNFANPASNSTAGTFSSKVLGSSVGSDVQLGLSVSDDGLKITTYLISEPICSGSGISQATVTIRWAKGLPGLNPNVTPELPNMNVSCLQGGVQVPDSPTHDFLFCSIEPDPNTNIPITFAAGVEIPFFTADVQGIGFWELEDLDNTTVLPGNDATKPYLNIQDIDCNTAASDQRNYIQIDPAGGVAANDLAYDEREVTNEGSLPVELTSFEASADGRDINLTWETATESENAGFSIERASLTGVYEEVAFVEGNGTTSEASSYQYVLNDVEFGVFKFRLKQVDFDGTSSYSSEVDVTVDIPDDIVLDPAYPNPFNPATNIRFAVKERQEVTLQLFDLQGRLVRTLYQGQMESGVMQNFRIDGSDLSSGTYLVQFRGSELKQTVTQKILLTK